MSTGSVTVFSVLALLAPTVAVKAHTCPPPPAAVCLFGEQFSDIRRDPALQIVSETWLRSLDDVSALTRLQIILAVRQSSHDDVFDAAEALARVDQQEVRDVELIEVASGRAFTVLEYGVGDNSYGAFFESGTTNVVASIHDGDLLRCQVTPARAEY